MSEQNKKEMVILWASIAEMYGKSKDIAGLMAKMSLQEGLTASQVADAWRAWMRQGKSAMPTFGDLLKILKPESNTSSRQLATQIASIVPMLIFKHGYHWGEGCFHNSCGFYWSGAGGYAYPSFDAAVRSYLGEFAPIVTKWWRTLCETWDDNPTTHFAQIRDRIESEIASSEHMKEQAMAIAHHQRELIAQGNKEMLALEQKNQLLKMELTYEQQE
ncbi:MAG: hypothetical protein WHU54_09635 [Candidatus Bathyarchaeia archaeon]